MLLAVAAATVAAACPANLANGLDVEARTKQLLTVEAKVARTTHATLQRWQRAANGCFVRVGPAYAARVGKNGMRANRREGDGTTPIGTFPIGARMYGTAPNPGVRFQYRRLRCGDWWDENPRSPTYNSFVHVRCGQRPPFGSTSDGMWQQPVPYAHLAVVEFNMNPVVPGRGSGIFLHAQTGGSTNGCISLRRDHLVTVLKWLRPAHRPQMALGTSATLRR
ncbi:MAG TPA: L,D-transpeptidase family protein [Gaiellaceae bacterium]|nr:L,D-transpeptidase family protein [Gaiellaceae bacterium]